MVMQDDTELSSADRTVTFPSSSRGRRTREALVTAARTVFERDGFLDSRIRDIADEAGVAHGSFYTYFQSKEEIFLEIALRLQTEMMRGERAGRQAVARDPVAAIEAANRRYLESYRANAALMGIIEQVETFDEDLRSIRQARTDSFVDRAVRAIERLQSQGLADRELDPFYTATALTSMVSRFAYVWFVNPGPERFDFDFEEAVATLTRIWANALQIPSGREYGTLEPEAPDADA